MAWRDVWHDEEKEHAIIRLGLVELILSSLSGGATATLEAGQAGTGDNERAAAHERGRVTYTRGSGTYRLEGSTLELSDSNGRTTRRTLSTPRMSGGQAPV
jgi:hypothetical protein